jgi:hypothetical protein
LSPPKANEAVVRGKIGDHDMQRFES